MKPPKRQRTTVKVYEPTRNQVRWTVNEKRELLHALKIYSADKLSEIKKFIPSRSEEEIRVYIGVVRNKSKRRPGFMKNIHRIDAPIEVWLKTAEDLTHYGNDSSHVLGQVMSIAGSLEPRPEAKNNIEPDYRRIYTYISALLVDETDLPKLRPIDAAVVLDMLEGIKAEMKSCDLTPQHQLMTMKHQALNTKVHPNNFSTVYELTRSALEGDPLEVRQSTQSTETLQVNEASMNPSAENGPSTSSALDGIKDSKTNTTQNNIESTNSVDSKSKGKASTSFKKDIRPTKSIMHSLNPFNVPVKYLRPRRKKTL